jgi:hypothetical protein
MRRSISFGRGDVRAIVAFVCVFAVALVSAGSITAAAPVQLGGAAPGPGSSCSAGFWHAQLGEATVPYTVPAGAWRLTHWSMWGPASVQFLVLRPAGGAAYTVVHTSQAFSLAGGLNTFSDSVKVVGGDEIGFGATTGFLGCFTFTGSPGDSLAFNRQPFSPGSILDPTAPPAPCNGCIIGWRLNLGATVEPIGKGDCKRGGWRGWPVFKNQGQCVKFVNHQGGTGGKGKDDDESHGKKKSGKKK